MAVSTGRLDRFPIIRKVGNGDSLTVIGIPFGLANFKIAEAAIAPLGKRAKSGALPMRTALSVGKPVAAAVLARRRAALAPEDLREVALVEEPGRHGDVGDEAVRFL